MNPMTSAALRVGIVGLGNISGQYFNHLQDDAVVITAIADANTARAAEVSAERGVPAMSVADLMASPEVDLVLNLTTPESHASLCRAALEAGKATYTEKPLATTFAEGRELVELAHQRNLLLGCAPDTVLGTGVQTARAAIAQGLIGTPVAANLAWGAPGHEAWHPNPEFYYQPGAGPLFDMGPYYLSTVVNLLGPVASVMGMTNTSDRSRVVATGPLQGRQIEVAVDTHVVALLQHVSGAVTTVTMSFELWGTQQPLVEVHGTSSSLSVPDPNGHAGFVELFDPQERRWYPLDELAGYEDAGRGIGVIDLARATAEGRAPRASGDIGLHVLEVMELILRSAHSKERLDVTTRPEVPSLVPRDTMR